MTQGEPVTLIAMGGLYPLTAFTSLLEVPHAAQLEGQGPGSTPVAGRKNQLTGLAAAAAAGIYSDATADIDAIAKNCGQFLWFEQTAGVIREPPWRLLAGVCVVCRTETARLYFHEISAGDPRYDERQAEDKLDRYNAAVEGAPRCITFHDSCAESARICEACPYWGKINSPIALGYRHHDRPQLVEADQAEPAQKQEQKQEQPAVGRAMIIFPGIDEDNGRLSMYTAGKKDAQKVPFLDTPVEIDKILINESDDKRQIIVSFVNPQTKQWTELMLSAEDVAAKVYERMLAYGVLIYDVPIFRAYFNMQYSRTSRITKTEICYDSFGVKDDQSCVWAGLRYSTDGVQKVYYTDRIKPLLSFMRPHADASLKRWVELIGAFWVRGFEPHVLTLLAGLASPLMRYASSGDGGCLLHTTGLTGGGKTTSQEAAISIYMRKMMTLNERDTANSRITVLGMIGGMPLALDDMKIDETAVDLVKAINASRDKFRLHNGGKEIVIPPNHWNTFFLSNANQSLYETLQQHADAQAWRVLEFTVPQLQQGTRTWQGDQLRNELFTHTGIAGHVFLEHVYCTPGRLAAIGQQLTEATEAIARQTPSWPPHTRFWRRGLAVMQVGGRIAHALGLFPAEPDYWIEWAIDELSISLQGDLKEAVLQADAINALTELLRTLQPATLAVSGSTMLNGGSDNAVFPIHLPRDPIAVRREPDRAYINTQVFQRKLVEAKHSWGRIRSELERRGVLSGPVLFDLGHGTGHLAAPTQCYVIDMNHPLLTGPQPSGDVMIPFPTQPNAGLH